MRCIWLNYERVSRGSFGATLRMWHEVRGAHPRNLVGKGPVGKNIKRHMAKVKEISPSAAFVDEDEAMEVWKALSHKIAEKYDPSAYGRLKDGTYRARWALEKILLNFGSAGFPARSPWPVGHNVILFWLDHVRLVACVIPAEEVTLQFSRYGHGTIAVEHPPQRATILLYDLNDIETEAMKLAL
ncbi:MAG: hypothetical protein ABL949_13395 [Fimbriimonadaceae bacterium]